MRPRTAWLTWETHCYLMFQVVIVLITSDHHYGAVMDRDFDFVKYLHYLCLKSDEPDPDLSGRDVRAARQVLARKSAGARPRPGRFSLALV